MLVTTVRQVETIGSMARTPRSRAGTVDAAALAAELRSRVRGEVRFDDGGRALYATDASNYRQVPIGVVLPRDAEDVVQTVAACRRLGAPILPRGCGTSLAGQCCNVAVVLDMSKHMHRLVALDPAHRRARVEPGIILDTLRDAAEQHHLTFGPDPATHDHCTLGGMMGNNSCGVHSIMAGRTAENVEELEILTYDGLRMRVGATSDEDLERIIRTGGRRGEIYTRLKALRDRYADQIRRRFPDIPRRVSGYGLDYLLPDRGFNVARALIGSEGTCVTILEATLRLVDSPPARSLLVLGYPDIYTAADHVPEIMSHGPIGLEAIDDRLVSYMEKKGLHVRDVPLLPKGGGWLLVEFGGQSKQESDDRAHAAMQTLRGADHPPEMKLYDDPDQEQKVWAIRESGLGATAYVPGMADTWPGWEDSAVAPEKLGGYLRDLRGLFDRYGYECALYGHFGQGCVHVRIDFDLVTAEGISRFRSFMDDAADLVVRYGGSLSGEHGDGQARAELLPKMFGDELMAAFREFKAIWDPDGKMNPGKVVDPYPIVSNLRLGTDYHPADVQTHFFFPADHGSFAHATLRCVGVGKCRRLGSEKIDDNTMCPSFMVTREEQHTTRGRARLLFEMLRGDALTDGWRSEPVKEALDLCLACKGCKGDCPVNVDMATYKAEFLSHYYEGRRRPRSAYAFGLIMYWARLASLAPRLVNLFTQTPVLRGAAKAAVGMAPQRQIPSFAPETFTSWFRRRGPRNQGAPRLLLWPDTFNNYFHPETAVAAVEVLEAAGYQVTIPERWLCCGRPLYDYGMLDRAKGMLRQILDALRLEIEAGVPVVGLEPSCVAVFRDELTNLFPHDEDAHRLARQTYMLSEFLGEKADGYQPPKLERKAIVQGHCHHKAVMKLDAEEALMRAIGLDYAVLPAGCCGMAGSFGFEAGDRYDVSIQAGERALLPAVRDAADDTLVIADGFSCREQIRQGTDRRALHVAQVLRMAMRDGPRGPAGPRPETRYDRHPAPTRSIVRIVALLGGAGAALAGGALAWRATRKE
jgi:FAD/FMN-containing dehydrogenase/Fe-S oxidoreductase